MPEWTQVHWLAVVIAAVANLVIGYVWYMPQVFGKRWREASGTDMAQPAGAMWAVVIVTSLVAAYVVAQFAGGAGVVNGAVWGFVLWLLVGSVMAGAVLFEGRSWTYWGINAGYWLLTLLVMGAIVGYFPRTL
jgi:hypothetical protein